MLGGILLPITQRRGRQRIFHSTDCLPPAGNLAAHPSQLLTQGNSEVAAPELFLAGDYKGGVCEYSYINLLVPLVHIHSQSRPYVPEETRKLL